MNPVQFPIRVKLLLLMLTVSAVTIAVFIALGLGVGKKVIVDGVSRQLNAVRATRTLQITTYLRQKRLDIQTISELPATQNWVRGGAIDPALVAISKRFGFLDVIYVDDKGVAQRSFGELPKDPQLGLRTLATFVGHGRREASLMDGLFSPSMAKPVRYHAVIPLASGGYLAAAFDHAEIDRIMTGGGRWEDNGLGTTGESYLVGRDGWLRSDSRFIIQKRSLPPTGEKSLGEAWASSDSGVGSISIRTEAVRMASTGAEGVIVQEGYGSAETLTSFGLVQERGIRWIAIAEISMDEAYAPVFELQRQLSIFAIATVIVVALLVMLVSRQFVQPIVRLTRAATEYEDGELEELPPVVTRDEVGALTAAFNQMVDRLEQIKETSLSLRRNIVHDLKTPVTVIRGCAETMRAAPDDVELREELLDDIAETSDRLLEDLIEIITPVADDWTPQPERFNLSALVHRAVMAERHTTRAKGHVFVVEGADAPIEVFADRRKIRRVVENLLSNAVKYSPGEGKAVTVTVRDEGDFVTIGFRDEGIGMTPDQLDKVLTESGRAVDDLLGIEGSGFGLESCRHVLQVHGGVLEAESTPGEGAIFTAKFPKSP